MAPGAAVSDRVKVELDDGSLLVPREFVEAVGEEYDARGGALTVAQAQVLIEKWANPPKVRA